jgi:predicted flap endonuclease-1-like 5' DNA nuclease
MHYLLTPTNLLWGGSSLALELLSKAQQQNQFAGIPFWVWILVVLLVIIFAVIWTLREEEEAGKKQEEPQATSATEPALATEPAVKAPAEPAPVIEAEPTPAAEAAAEPAPATEPAPPPRPDNLKLVSGIGPKIEALLKDNGIMTFAQLAETEVSRLDALLDEADWYMSDPSTWPEQARKLAQEKSESG